MTRTKNSTFHIDVTAVPGAAMDIIMMPVRPEARLFAAELACYPNSLAVWRTFFRVYSGNRPLPLSESETVVTDTPAALATCLIVTLVDIRIPLSNAWVAKTDTFLPFRL